MWECPWCNEIIEVKEEDHHILCPLCENKSKFKDIYYDSGGGGSYIQEYTTLVKVK